MADGHDKLEAQVLTPEGEVFSGELVQLSTRTSVGEVGILARHAPMLARLVPAELRLHISETETERYAQGEGWLEVFANRARVLIAGDPSRRARPQRSRAATQGGPTAPRGVRGGNGGA